jgi:hypothetical protein
MALFFECMLQCARKVLTLPTLLEMAIYRQSSPHVNPVAKERRKSYAASRSSACTAGTYGKVADGFRRTQIHISPRDHIAATALSGSTVKRTIGYDRRTRIRISA